MALVVPQLKLMGLLLAAMAVLLMAVVGAQLLASRWRAPRVFIIYQNAAADRAAELHPRWKNARRGLTDTVRVPGRSLL